MNKCLIVVMLLMGFIVPLGAEELMHDFDGHPKKLADYTGKGDWLLVMIWAHDCLVCNQEAHSYLNFHEKHKSKDAKILGISIDGKKYEVEAKKFIERHKLTFTNLIAEPEEVAGIYEDLTGQSWQGTPTFMIYNPKGELRAQQIGAVPVELIEQFIEKDAN